jgi:actin-like ATPase involved in cell morphogenesis
MPVHIADDPLTCVVRGNGVVLEANHDPYMDRALVAETYSRPGR